MNNLPLKPLVWTECKPYEIGYIESATSISHGYIVITDYDKFLISYYPLTGGHAKQATGFATIDEAKAWAWNHYNEKMQPYVKQTMLYPAQFEEVFEVFEDCRNEEVKASDGFVVTFRDVPEAITQGDTYADALDMAQDALSTAMEFYDEANKPRPKPSEPQQGDVMISLSTVQNNKGD